MAVQESIIYSYDLATVPSILPAFANARDLIVCDEVGLQQTLDACAVPCLKHVVCT